MEAFIGTWTFVESDNFEPYLKALGIAAPLRKLANLTTPTVIISDLGNGEYSVKTDAVVRSVVVTFKFGEKVGETTVDFRKVESVFTLEDETLVWTSTDKNGLTTVVRRTISSEGIMLVEMEVRGITATAKFKKS
ncbi:myelin P2 protein [Eurytemora carolleeae]|uniref:myelin P2 protein n=1 Tax=Eurytemora carolleeae TaxID=1294199 RepID=UPI000C77ACA2|nr:myelin P2 protein [Eurytemora carolleeae]|eukprot:XP_023345672.1 myelin P2 protein-like [Eurytemora affinis]